MSEKITFLGQCGFAIETEDGLKIAIDPVLTELFDDDGNDIRHYPPVFEPEKLSADYIICTHDHIDHMAIPTIKRAMSVCEKTKVIVPKGCMKLLLAAGLPMEKIIDVSDCEEKIIEAGKLSVKGISAAHPTHHLDEDGLDRNLVFAIKIAGKGQYVHLGDTYLTERLENDLKELGKIYMLFLPINGQDEERSSKGIIGNLDCKEAAYLSSVLKPSVAVPTHFDMVIGNTANPEEFIHCIKEIDEDIDCYIPELGKIMS